MLFARCTQYERRSERIKIQGIEQCCEAKLTQSGGPADRKAIWRAPLALSALPRFGPSRHLWDREHVFPCGKLCHVAHEATMAAVGACLCSFSWQYRGRGSRTCCTRGGRNLERLRGPRVLPPSHVTRREQQQTPSGITAVSHLSLAAELAQVACRASCRRCVHPAPLDHHSRHKM